MIKHYVIKIVSDRSMVSPDNPVSSPNKTDCHDIVEILLKVALHTINLKSKHRFFGFTQTRKSLDTHPENNKPPMYNTGYLFCYLITILY